MGALKPRTTQGETEVEWDGKACTVRIPVGDDEGRLVIALSGEEAQELGALLTASTA